MTNIPATHDPDEWRDGLCECGVCGLPAPIATYNKPSRGVVKGQPQHFRKGHHNIVDLTGKTFGRLTVKSFEGIKNTSVIWNTTCMCGKEVPVSTEKLKNGNTKSCGCLNIDKIAERNVLLKTIHGHARKGKTSPTYISWSAMLGRCTRVTDRHWKDYGGVPVPVAVCDSWFTFENFLSVMGVRPDGTTLGRILDRGNYEPNNAFWMTQGEQSLAQRNNHALSKWEAAQ